MNGQNTRSCPSLVFHHRHPRHKKSIGMPCQSSKNLRHRHRRQSRQSSTFPAPAPHTPTAHAIQSDGRPPARQSVVDMDVDTNGVSPELRGGDIFTMQRDIGGEDIIRKLEKGLPGWQGFGDYGWMADTTPVRRRFSNRQLSSISDVCCRTAMWKFYMRSKPTRISCLWRFLPA